MSPAYCWVLVSQSRKLLNFKASPCVAVVVWHKQLFSKIKTHLVNCWVFGLLNSQWVANLNCKWSFDVILSLSCTGSWVVATSSQLTCFINLFDQRFQSIVMIYCMNWLLQSIISINHLHWFDRFLQSIILINRHDTHSGLVIHLFWSINLINCLDWLFWSMASINNFDRSTSSI